MYSKQLVSELNQFLVSLNIVYVKTFYPIPHSHRNFKIVLLAIRSFLTLLQIRGPFFKIINGIFLQSNYKIRGFKYHIDQ